MWRTFVFFAMAFLTYAAVCQGQSRGRQHPQQTATGYYQREESGSHAGIVYLKINGTVRAFEWWANLTRWNNTFDRAAREVGAEWRIRFDHRPTDENENFTLISATYTGRSEATEPYHPSAVTSDVRTLDFKNFTYRSSHRPPIRTQTGRYETEVADIIYGDLTGDGKEEAAVILNRSVSADSAAQYLYLVTLINGKVAPLADLDEATSSCLPGDECGGIIGIKIHDGILSVDRGIYTDQDGKCCPSLHRVTRYRWDGHQLVELDKTRVTRRS